MTKFRMLSLGPRVRSPAKVVGALLHADVGYLHRIGLTPRSRALLSESPACIPAASEIAHLPDVLIQNIFNTIMNSLNRIEGRLCAVEGQLGAVEGRLNWIEIEDASQQDGNPHFDSG
ncbi:hypothetical protein E4T56_gene16905 [Termitomyces sp. T112]|nr:hypothetical protein E4T56_gene16905 [Termitomyces sp. T112]